VGAARCGAGERRRRDSGAGGGGEGGEVRLDLGRKGGDVVQGSGWEGVPVSAAEVRQKQGTGGLCVRGRERAREV